MMLSPRFHLVVALLAGFATANLQDRIDTKIGPRRGNNVQFNSSPVVTEGVNSTVGRNSMQPLATQQLNTGRSLDANLLAGSGGYNHTTPSYGVFSQPSYAPGSSRDIYTLNSYGEIVYNPGNAFAPRRYDPTGVGVAGRAGSAAAGVGSPDISGHTTAGTQHRTYSPTYLRRFRYQSR